MSGNRLTTSKRTAPSLESLKLRVPIDPNPTSPRIDIRDDPIPDERYQALSISLDHQYVVSGGSEDPVDPTQGYTLQGLDAQPDQVGPIKLIGFKPWQLISAYPDLQPYQGSSLVPILTTLQLGYQAPTVGLACGKPPWSAFRTQIPGLVGQ